MCDYKNKSLHARKDLHIRWLERMLDDAWQQIEKLSKFHEDLDKVSKECSEITTKYMDLQKAYEELEEEYMVMLQLIHEDKGGELN